MSESPIKKIGELKIKTGEYTDKDGKTKGRYQTVGVLFGTPHHSRLSVKFPATAFSDEKWANVYYDEGCSPRSSDNDAQIERQQVVDEPIRPEDIPF